MLVGTLLLRVSTRLLRLLRTLSPIRTLTIGTNLEVRLNTVRTVRNGCRTALLDLINQILRILRVRPRRRGRSGGGGGLLNRCSRGGLLHGGHARTKRLGSEPIVKPTHTILTATKQ